VKDEKETATSTTVRLLPLHAAHGVARVEDVPVGDGSVGETDRDGVCVACDADGVRVWLEDGVPVRLDDGVCVGLGVGVRVWLDDPVLVRLEIAVLLALADGVTVRLEVSVPVWIDGVPVLLDDGVPVLLDDGVPVLLDDGVPVWLDDGVPVLLDDAVPVWLDDGVPVWLAAAVPVSELEPLVEVDGDSPGVAVGGQSEISSTSMSLGRMLSTLLTTENTSSWVPVVLNA
jgi:uncharacterized protein YbaR (Trm112 family)